MVTEVEMRGIEENSNNNTNQSTTVSTKMKVGKKVKILKIIKKTEYMLFKIQF